MGRVTLRVGVADNLDLQVAVSVKDVGDTVENTTRLIGEFIGVFAESHTFQINRYAGCAAG